MSMPRGYIHVYDHYSQTFPSLKLLGQLDTIKMATMPIYVQNIKNLFFFFRDQKSYGIQT